MTTNPEYIDIRLYDLIMALDFILFILGASKKILYLMIKIRWTFNLH